MRYSSLDENICVLNSHVHENKYIPCIMDLFQITDMCLCLDITFYVSFSEKSAYCC